MGYVVSVEYKVSNCFSYTVLTDHSTSKRYLIPFRATPIILIFSPSISASKTYETTTSIKYNTSCVLMNRKTTYRCGTGMGAPVGVHVHVLCHFVWHTVCIKKI